MSVRVNMPIRLRVQAHGLDGRLDEVGDAVKAAVARALAASRRVVLEPRGGYVVAYLRPPAFRWMGRPNEIAPPIRGALEACITEAIDAAVNRAVEYTRAAAVAPNVLPDAIFEPFNPLHYDPRAGTYEIPSYRGKPKKTKTPLKRPATKAKAKKARKGAQFRTFARGDRPLGSAITEALDLRYGGVWPQYFGAMFLIAGDPHLVLQLYKRGATSRSAEQTVSFHLTRPPLEEGQKDSEPVSDLSPAAQYTFEWESDGGDSEGLRNHRARLEQTYKDKNGPKDGKLMQLEVIERQRQLDKKARDYVAKLTEGYENSVGAYYVINDGVKPVFFQPVKEGVAALVLESKNYSILSLTEVAEVEVSEEGMVGIRAEGMSEEGRVAGTGIGDEPGFEGGVPWGRGVVQAPEYAQGIEFGEGARFVGPTGAVRVAPECEPYDREPSIDELGAGGEELRRLIAQIADRLTIPTCGYAGNFAIQAGRVLEDIADQLMAVSIENEKGFMRALSVGARDDQGKFYFEPVPSISIQYLVYLARTVPLVHKLIDRTAELMALPINNEKAPFAWSFHFREKAYDAAVSAVKKIYLYACQVCLLQLLNASRDNILQRQQNFDTYVKTFRILVTTLLSDQVELILLQNALTKFKSYVGNRTGEDAYEAVQWRLQFELEQQIARPAYGYVDPKQQQQTFEALTTLAEYRYAPDLLLRLADPKNFVQARGATEGVSGAGAITQRKDGAWVIRDSNGWDWTLDELRASVQLRQQYVQSIDPLVTQISKFVSEVKPLAEDPSKVEGFVRDLLATMMRKNDEVAADTRSDYRYAFEHGIFHENLTNPTIPGTRYNLQGVHLLAHQAIGEAFRDPFYLYSVDNLIGHELGSKALLDDLLFFGTITVSIFCPPLGAALGVASGIVAGIGEYRHAKELETIYKSLFKPEEVLSRAEIEVQMFVAQLGLALSILGAIPEAKAAIKAASTTTKAILREGAKGAVKKIAVEAVHAELLKLANVFKGNLAKAFALALVEQKLQDVVVNYLLGEVIDAKIKALEELRGAEGTPSEQKPLEVLRRAEGTP